jgi:flavin-dependent dehydrogenase
VEKSEIVVCGASVAGALAGYVCARLGRATAIIGSRASAQPGEVLAAEAGAVLEQLGLGHLLVQADHVRCAGISHVTADGRSYRPWPGFILDRAAFVADLVSAAVGAGCHLIDGNVETVTRDVAGKCLLVRVGTATPTREIRTEFAIDASGRKAFLARHLGASRRVLTNLAAAWATLPSSTVAIEPGTLAIEGAETHWWYMAVGRRNVATAAMGRRPPKDPAAWLAAARSTSILRDLPLSAAMRAVIRPANVSVVEPACGPRWVACGDAAATFDPLSGYGLAFAIGTGYASARTADASLRGDRLAPIAYQELVADRVHRAWSGLDESYASLAPASHGRLRAAVSAPA